MPRERKGFRDQLENIIAAHPQGEQMSVKEVAKCSFAKSWPTLCTYMRFPSRTKPEKAHI